METSRLKAINKCRVYVPTWLLLAVICQSVHTHILTLIYVCGRHITHTPGLHGDNATVGNICVKYFLCVNDNKRINLSMLLPPPVTQPRPSSPLLLFALPALGTRGIFGLQRVSLGIFICVLR